MRKQHLLLGLALFCSAACSHGTSGTASLTGLHTINGTTPLYVDGRISGTQKPLLHYALVDQVKTMSNLGDALRVLGPAYLAPDDPTHIPRWYFSNHFTLTLWPQGGETLADAISVYPLPNCGVPVQECRNLILGRQESEAENPPDPDQLPQSTRAVKDQPAVPQPPPNTANNQAVSNQVVNSSVSVINAFGQSLAGRVR